MKQGRRVERVAALMHRELGWIIQELKDSRIGFVTITDVELSADLRNAKIYYSVLGDETVKKETATALTELLPKIRHQIASRVLLRYVPELKLFYDESSQRAARILQIMQNLKKIRIGSRW